MALVKYKGVVQQGDYSRLNRAEIYDGVLNGFDWVGYYYHDAPSPDLGVEERELWLARNALLHDKLKDAGIDI